MTESDSARHATEWQIAYAAIVVAAAALLVFSMRAVLSPFLVLALFVLLISPFAGSRRHRIALIAAGILFLVWLLDTLGALVAPFVLAVGIAYLLDPAVDWLQRLRLPRALGIAVLVIPVIAALAIGLIFAVPAIAGQLLDLAQSAPSALERLTDWLRGLLARASAWDLPLVPDDLPNRWLQSLQDEQIATYLESRRDEILSGAWGAALGVGRGVQTVLAVVGYVVLTPVVTVYVLRDFDHVTAKARDLIPVAKRDHWVAFFKEYDELLSRFLRGQVVAAAIVGVLTWLGLFLVGFPYSGLVGGIAGVFNLVPYLGLIASALPVLIIALASGSVAALLLKAAAVFVVVQLIDGTVTGPRIVGTSVGLHPVWVMLALALGSFFFGFVGLLLAMPAAVLVKLLLRDALIRYRESDVFRAGAADGELSEGRAGAD